MILPISDKVGDFADGELVIGQTSGAKGIVATHFLRCQGEVNPLNVAIPVKFKTVFEPAGIPPPEVGIALTGVEGTFQVDETVVGETSGATATVDEWPTEFNRVPGDNYILRRGDANDYENAKTDYENDPYWSVMEVTAYDVFPMWGNEDRYPQTPRYYVLAWQSYLNYDTHFVSPISSAKLVFTVNSIFRAGTAENPTIYIYKYDYGTLDSGDWSGGTKIAEREFTDADVGNDVEISLDPSDVSPGDYSKYRIILKRTEDLAYWPEPSSYYQLQLNAKPVKLVLTY